MTELVIETPFPHPALNPNGRPHYMAKANQVRKSRALAKELALKATCGNEPRLEKACVRFDVYHKTKSFRDPDNIIAMMKSVIDGFVDAGVFDDDRDLTYLPPGRYKDAKAPRVVTIITPQD